MKVTKKHLFKTFRPEEFRQCDGCECGACEGIEDIDISDSSEELAEKIENLLTEGYEVDVYLVKRK